jgi:hypothetical protein
MLTVTCAEIAFDWRFGPEPEAVIVTWAVPLPTAVIVGFAPVVVTVATAVLLDELAYVTVAPVAAWCVVVTSCVAPGTEFHVVGLTVRLCTACPRLVIVIATEADCEFETRPVPLPLAVIVTMHVPTVTAVTAGLAPVAGPVQFALLYEFANVTVAPGEEDTFVLIATWLPACTDAAVGLTVMPRIAFGNATTGLTVSEPDAERFASPFDFAVITALPAATLVTTPVVALTVATPVFDDDQVTVRSIVPVPPFVCTDAENWVV